MATNDSDPTLARLDDQINWYDRSSITAQRRYKLLKAVQLIAAAALPVMVPFDVHAAVPAAIGALIIVVEGFQQLNQYQQNWISYRSTCEALRHEKYLYLAGAGPYADTPNTPGSFWPTASTDSSPKNTPSGSPHAKARRQRRTPLARNRGRANPSLELPKPAGRLASGGR